MPFLPGSKLPQLLQTEQTFKSKATIYTHAGKECDRKENSPKKFLNLSKNSKGQKRHGFPFFKPVPGGAGWHGIKASLTLEAAIALPVMIFALYLLMFPIKVMDAERRLQNSMEAAAEKLSLAEYIKTVGDGLINTDSEYMDTVDGVISGVEQGAAACFIHPKGSELKLLESAGKSGSSDLYDKLYERCNNEISKIFLGNTLTTEASERGTQSLGTVQEKGEKKINESDRQLILNVLNYDMTDIFESMGYDTRGGEFVYVEPKETNITVIADVITKMRNAGTPVSDDTFYELTGIPKPENYDR